MTMEAGLITVLMSNDGSLLLAVVRSGRIIGPLLDWNLALNVMEAATLG